MDVVPKDRVQTNSEPYQSHWRLNKTIQGKTIQRNHHPQNGEGFICLVVYVLGVHIDCTPMIIIIINRHMVEHKGNTFISSLIWYHKTRPVQRALGISQMCILKKFYLEPCLPARTDKQRSPPLLRWWSLQAHRRGGFLREITSSYVE